MESVTNNLNAILPFMVGSWVLLIALSLWKPQRFKNAFLLQFALLMSFLTIAGFFGDNMVNALFAFAIIALSALLLVPLMLIHNGVTVIQREGRSLANMLSLILGIVVAIGEMAWFITMFSNVLIDVDKKVYGLVVLLGLTIFYVSSIVLTFVLYNIYIQYIPDFVSFDYVIIHGCGLLGGKDVSPLLASRIDKAISVYNKCKTKPVIIPSGGQGSDESISEAEAMKRYLVEHGIPEDKIYMEDKSTTTMENLANCKAYIESRETSGKKRIALVSSNYHVYRCLLYAEKLKMRCIGIGAKVAWYYWPTALLREFVAVFTRPKYIIWTLIGYLIFVVLPIWQMFMK